MEGVDAHSVADSTVAGLPRDRLKALRAVRAMDGAYVSASDDEILGAIPTLAQGCGVFAEPAAAAAYAGLARAVEQDWINRDEHVLAPSTGSGLKDVAAVMEAVQKEPSVVERALVGRCETSVRPAPGPGAVGRRQTHTHPRRLQWSM